MEAFTAEKSLFIRHMIEVLGLPKNTVAFTLQASVGDMVTIKCLYYPDVDEEHLVSKRFKLIKEEVVDSLPPRDPVHYDFDAWFFWDESWAHRHGPFESEQRAREELKKYAEWLEGGGDDADQEEFRDAPK